MSGAPSSGQAPSRISGVGCCLLDLLYDLPPGRDRLAPWLSRAPDDGGVVRGGAVQKSQLERRTGTSVDDWLAQVAGDLVPVRSLGGVGVVTLIAAAQLLPEAASTVQFHACLADDSDGDWILGQIAGTPLARSKLLRRPGRCPTSIILNERQPGGAHERSFVAEGSLAEALALAPGELDPDFFGSDLVVFGNVQWEPRLSERLTELLAACRRAGALTVLGAAFEPSRRHADGRWRLGDSDEVYRHLDLLLMDRTEALGYSGEKDPDRALRFFQRQGVGAVGITAGLEPVRCWAKGPAWAPAEGAVPIPSAIVEDQARGRLPTGDTVGCGDNFAGGVVASLALQRRAGGALGLLEAVRLGNLSGALASTHAGGVFQERVPGEKGTLVERYRPAYEAQLGAEVRVPPARGPGAARGG